MMQQEKKEAFELNKMISLHTVNQRPYPGHSHAQPHRIQSADTLSS